MQKKVIEIDGDQFDSLDGFFDEVERRIIPGAYWGRNLDAFNDILRGGFGTPDEGFSLRWKNSERSRVTLGYSETIQYLEQKILRCHPESVPYVQEELESARRGQGPTLFDIIIEIVRVHCVGGDEQLDGIELELE